MKFEYLHRMMNTLYMEVETKGRIKILIPHYKQIDVLNSDEFGKELDEALEIDAPCILDLTNIAFIDSSGLGRIVSALRGVNAIGRKLVICGMNPSVELLFRMVRLDQISRLTKTRHEAEFILSGVS